MKGRRGTPQAPQTDAGQRFDSFDELRAAVHARCWAILDAEAAKHRPGAGVDRTAVRASLAPYSPKAAPPPALESEADRLLAAVIDALEAADEYLRANPTAVATSFAAKSLEILLSSGGTFVENRPDREPDGTRRSPKEPLRANNMTLVGYPRWWLAIEQRQVWDDERIAWDARSRHEKDDPSAAVAIDMLVSSRRLPLDVNSRGRLVHAFYRMGAALSALEELPAVDVLVALSLLAGHFPDGIKHRQDHARRVNEKPTAAEAIAAERKAIVLAVERLASSRLAALGAPSTSRGG